MARAYQLLALCAISAIIAVQIVACSNGKRPAPIATPVAATPATTASPEATPTPETIGGLPVRPLIVAKADTTLAGAALYLAVSGHGDAPPRALDRVYVDQAGNYSRRRLFERTIDNSDGRGTIQGIGIDSEAAHIFVAVCDRSYCGGVGNIQAGAHVTLYLSDDGGLSWKQAGAWDGGGFIVGVTPSWVVWARPYRGPDGAALVELSYEPTHQVIATLPPAGSSCRSRRT
jgi:hypothetical protein